jgi:hypothetical protein
MSLNVRVEDGRSQTKTLVLEGRLDNDSVGALDEALDTVLASAVQVVVFDLTRSSTSPAPACARSSGPRRP